MRVTIGMKVGVAFGIASLAAAGFVALTVQNSFDDNKRLEDLSRLDQARSLTQDLELQTANVWQYMTDASLTRNDAALKGDAGTAFTAAKKDLTELGALTVLPNQNSLMAPLEASFNDFLASGNAMYGAYGRSKEEGNKAMEAFDAAGANLLKNFQALRDPLYQLRADQLKSYQDNLAQDLLTFAGLGLFAIAILLASWILLSRTLSRSISTSSQALRTLADSRGDLTYRLPVKGSDETADLAVSVNDFLQKLHKVLVNIDETIHKNHNLADALNQSARDSAASVENLEHKVSELKANLQSLDLDIAGASAAVEEIMANIGSLARQIINQDAMVSKSGTAIQQMMASITGVSQLAEQKVASVRVLEDLTHQGGERVRKTNAVIEKVAQNADAMLGLIDLINDISDRTNLLAMNASIEAAHAGMAGRGFAVVADEIRKLAATTGSNAQKIGESLKESGNHIRQAQQDGMATQETFVRLEEEMVQFASAMKDVSESMGGMSEGGIEVLAATAELIQSSQIISNSSQEMEYGAKEVLKAVGHVKQVSGDALNQIREVDTLAVELNRAALRVSAFGNQNRYNNTILTSEVGKFQLGEAAESRTNDVSLGIDWNDILYLNIAAMDDEHKELFKRINALLVGLLADGSQANIPALMGAVLEYTVYHFDDEQNLLIKTKYPKYDTHKGLHEIFLKELGEIQALLVAGQMSAKLLIRIQDKVVNWLLDHIAKVDHDYSEYILGLEQTKPKA